MAKWAVETETESVQLLATVRSLGDYTAVSDKFLDSFMHKHSDLSALDRVNSEWVDSFSDIESKSTEINETMQNTTKLFVEMTATLETLEDSLGVK